MTQQQPYFSLYSITMRDQLITISDGALRVFLTLATYINSQGICYPGVRELSARTGYRVEDVQRCIDELAQEGWIRFIRQNERDPLTGHWLPNIYALNSRLVALPTTLTPDPDLGTNSGSRLIQKDTQSWITPDPDLGIFLDHNHHHNQNQQTTYSEPESVNHHHQQNSALKNDGGSPTRPEMRLLQRSDSTTGPTADGSRTPPPNGGNQKEPPRGESLAAYSAPLPDGDAESVVDALSAACGNMTTPNARRLVARHGVKRARAAISVLEAQPDIANRAGFVRWLLEQGGVDADRDGDMDRHGRRFSGDIMDFVIS